MGARADRTMFNSNVNHKKSIDSVSGYGQYNVQVSRTVSFKIYELKRGKGDPICLLVIPVGLKQFAASLVVLLINGHRTAIHVQGVLWSILLNHLI